jgi:hypothetical protein
MLQPVELESLAQARSISSNRNQRGCATIASCILIGCPLAGISIDRIEHHAMHTMQLRAASRLLLNLRTHAPSRKCKQEPAKYNRGTPLYADTLHDRLPSSRDSTDPPPHPKRHNPETHPETHLPARNPTAPSVYQSSFDANARRKTVPSSQSTTAGYNLGARAYLLVLAPKVPQGW